MNSDTSSFKPQRVIGLMSGTSMDGIDAAYIETDGEDQLSPGVSISQPYESKFRTKLGQFIEVAPERQGAPGAAELEQELTDLHEQVIHSLLEKMDSTLAEIDLVGFHGQTIWHRPDQGQTWQMGDGSRLAASLSTPVVFDFRAADMEAGGQGAPLAPVFHEALTRGAERPLAVVNIGGVANITWIGPSSELIAFDTGPGCGLIDDLMRRCCDLPMDKDGSLAARGKPHQKIVETMMSIPFFDTLPPKSLDRFDFKLDPVLPLDVEDGAATLVALTADCIHRGLQLCPTPPTSLYVTGGGRLNPVLLSALAQRTGITVQPVEALGWNGDAVEAQAFAYMAVRSLRELPITFPGTTGVDDPLPGGRIARG